jgi:hypothetical protein
LHFPVGDVVRNVNTFLQSVKVVTNTAGKVKEEQDPNKPRKFVLKFDAFSAYGFEVENPITKVILSSTQGPGISLSDVL